MLELQAAGRAGSSLTETKQTQIFKIICSAACLLILAAQVWSMAHWSERRGIFDDIGYLRQAHLFQRFGVAGLDTDITRDDDHFFSRAAADIRDTAWSDPNAVAPFVHTYMPKSGKWVLQYPPGTGFLLALFPEGHQSIWLYVSATLIIFLVSLVAIAAAETTAMVLTCGAFGFAAIYFMINPCKASYSIAPTMVVCALVGFLTPSFFRAPKIGTRLLTATAIGLLLGTAVNFRIANAFLAVGYLVTLGVLFIRDRSALSFACGAAFSAAFVLGTAPTLIANTINAGSPFTTTYSTQDVTAPVLNLTIIAYYLRDTQGILILIALAAIGWMLVASKSALNVSVALIVGANLLFNSAYFLSHSMYTPYYLMPVAMLSLWTLLFTRLASPRAAPR